MQKNDASYVLIEGDYCQASSSSAQMIFQFIHNHFAPKVGLTMLVQALEEAHFPKVHLYALVAGHKITGRKGQALSL